MPKLTDDTWTTRRIRIDKRLVSVLASADETKFKVDGYIGTIDKRGRAFGVRWKEAQVRVDADGHSRKVYRKRRQAVSTLEGGLRLLLEINQAHDGGQTYEAEREQPKATMVAISTAYLRASYAGRPEATANFRASLLQRWLQFIGDDAPVSKFTTGTLHEYAEFVRNAGIKSVSRYVGVVEQLWRWAHNYSDTYPGVPEPKRITGRDADIPHPVSPVAVDTPTWADVDLMIHAMTPEGASAWIEEERARRAKAEGLRIEQVEMRGYGYRPMWELHRRVALFQRFTGLRVSQILNTDSTDIDLDQLHLAIRAGRAGAKGQRRDRVVPLHPALAELIRGWDVGSGPLFTKVATKGPKKGQAVVPRGDEVAAVFTGAWTRSGVKQSKWGVTAGREKARPTNAIRARWKSTIAGVASYEIAAMMVGQSTRGEHDEYIAMGNPAASPYWGAMVEALGAVPGGG